MKKLTFFSAVAFMTLFQCTVTDGPDGPIGREEGNGPNGEEAYVFEYELSFTAPEYSVLLPFPDGFVALDSDVVLAYLLWEVTDGVEVWRPLPQTLYLTESALLYNFDFTEFDASVFLEGSAFLDDLGAAYTDNWVARLVIIPGQFASGRASINFSDYDDVASHYQLPPSTWDLKLYPERPK